MSNDLVESLSGGELQVYSPGESLAPVDSWTQNTDVDLLHERQHAPRTLTFFGTPLAAGVTEAHVQATLNELGTLFINDMGALKYPANLIGFAAKYFRESALKPPRQVRAVHNFDLPSELASDWMANDFCNCLENIKPGTKREKQQFLTAAITWLAKLAKHVSKTPGGSGGMPRMATNSGNGGLSDAEYNALYDYNEKMKPRTMAILSEQWGDAYQINLRMVDSYLQSLSDVEKQHFDTFLNNGLHALNDPTVILGLWGQAIGINNVPRGGAALITEIEECQHVMKVDRKRWLADERLQARYRELIRIRDGG